MRRKFSTIALLVAWLCANGAVWNVVQVVAWAKMFQDYSAVMPVHEALRVTFVGGEACDLCHVAQSAQDTARDQLPRDDALGGSDRVVLAFHATPPVVVIAPDFAWPGLANEAGLTRTDAVPVPPPRV
ncbi:MAG: hypothetical protein HZA32_19890 [Opitutae bacterium]|nr:hypothetical protein [Opitutae bacterium]